MQSTEERNRRGFRNLIVVLFLGALLVSLAVFGITQALREPQKAVASAAASQLLGPINAAKDDQVSAAVHAAQTAIQQAISLNSDTADVSAIPLQQAYPGVTVTASGSASAYTITGRNAKSGYTYTYTSTTGQYAAG